MSNGLSDEDVCNMALDLAHVRGTVSTLSTDNTPQAEVCRRWFSPTANQLLEMAPWPHARAAAALTELVERDFTSDWVATDPPPRWRYTYSVPTNLARPRHLSTLAQFEYGYHNSGGGGRAIYTNQESAVLIYTKKNTATSTWSYQFVQAVASVLAARICGSLKGSRVHTRELMQQAQLIVLEAQTAMANAEQDRLDWVPDWLQARGFVNLSSATYVYPVEPFTVLQSASPSDPV